MTALRPIREHVVELVIQRGERRGVIVDVTSARSVAALGVGAGFLKVDDACRLVHLARNDDIELSFGRALRRLDACAGNVEDAFRRLLGGGVEFREGVSDGVRFAAARGLAYTPHSIYDLIKHRGRDGMHRYLEDLGRIMDAAAVLGTKCPQTLAIARLARVKDADRVIAELAAAARRRADRRSARCRVIVPPRQLADRANALAGCGCPRCKHRLAQQMDRYITKMLAAPRFRRLDPEEARAEAHLELVQSIDTWPGGNFTGWFSARFKNVAHAMYEARFSHEEPLSLDTGSLLDDDNGGRTIPLAERIPDRSVDVLEIVLIRERVAEQARARRIERALSVDAFGARARSG